MHVDPTAVPPPNAARMSAHVADGTRASARVRGSAIRATRSDEATELQMVEPRARSAKRRTAAQDPEESPRRTIAVAASLEMMLPLR